MPKRIKKRRKIESDDPEVDAGWEEYFDYIFPEDEGAKPNLKLLAMAKMWKKQKETEPPTQVCSLSPFLIWCTLWCHLEDTVLLIGTVLLFSPILFPKYEA